eukprot:CAMPEP_0172408724 /NCGR_PEP_ID=MMETSP1061-20121228/76004_1 /TAXON_ID=37318 /ORGANISM="Pseudo-nitzschia pungens, Strain cf. pungens" /LENGTH=1225 /DNA_ID=CAMNT_0013144865 /DNA_START=207 /DNA_END=3886 /DNA_ORIENTATION=-
MADLFEDSEFQFHSLSLSSSLGRQQEQLREQQQQQQHSNSSNNNNNNNVVGRQQEQLREQQQQQQHSNSSNNNNNNNTNDWQEILRTASNDSSSCLSNLSASWIDLEGHPNQPAADHFGIDSSSTNTNTNTNTNDVFRPLQHIDNADDGDDFDADTNVDVDVDVDADVDFFDALEVDPSSAQPESVGDDAKFTNDERDRAQATTVRDSPNHPELVEQEEAENETRDEDDDPYVDVQQTCTEHVEGYDWEGILDLRRRLLGQQKQKQQQQQQQQESRQEQQQQQGRRERELSTSAAVRYVTNGSLYLTGDDDLLLEEASSVVTQALERDRFNEALHARADGGDEGETTTERTNQSAATDHGVVGNGHDEDKDENENEIEDEIAFRAGSPCPRIPVQEKETDPIQHGGHQASTAAADDGDDLEGGGEEEEGNTLLELHLSPLDVLASTLVGMSLNNAAQSQFRGQQQRFLHLTELRIGGPFLELSERGIERLAEALRGGGDAIHKPSKLQSQSQSQSFRTLGLKTLVLSVPAIDRRATDALEEFFRSPNAGCLEEFSLWARTATELRVGARALTRIVPLRSVLGPALSGWVDAWTSASTSASTSTSTSTSSTAKKRSRRGRSHKRADVDVDVGANPDPGRRFCSLRSLTLARMDPGNEGALALSRLVLAAPNLERLLLAQNEFDETTPQRDARWTELEREHPPLSFAGTKRLLESLILIEDLKKPRQQQQRQQQRQQQQQQQRQRQNAKLNANVNANANANMNQRQRQQQQQQQRQRQQQNAKLNVNANMNHTEQRHSLHSNLLELDISGWVLEENFQTNDSGDGGFPKHDSAYDEDKLVDNYYDDFHYGINGDDSPSGDHHDFEFDGDDLVGRNTQRNETSGHPPSRVPDRRIGKLGTRACCVVASMLRVNTSLKRLVLAPEGGSGVGSGNRTSRSRLSVRSTLAIARALRDHVSVLRSDDPNNKKQRRDRPAGSRLETLVLSTDYYSGDASSSSGSSSGSGGKNLSCSSWIIQERKRSVAKVFWQALTDRPNHQVCLQDLSCTLDFANLEPIPGSGEPMAMSMPTPRSGTKPESLDLKEQLERLLRNNKDINQSWKRIRSVWIPRLSSLIAIPEVTEEDNDDHDCQFVMALDRSESSDPSGDPSIAAATAVSSLPKLRPKRPPTIVLILPELLERVGRETAQFDAVFHAATTLACSTDLWDEAVRYRCKHRPRYRGRRCDSLCED